MDPRFQDTRAKSRVQQPTYFFTINCLLCSRVDVGLLTERDHYEEDVDAYLEHLLACLSNPSSLGRSRKYLSKYDAEVIKQLAKSREARLRYTVYRTDADFLLLSVGTFASRPMRRGRGRQEPIEEGYIGRGKTYYHFAYSYSQRLHVRNTVTADVLEKLVLGFERYTRILAQMRQEDGNLLDRLRRGERFILERVVNEERAEEVFLQKQDELLEAIAEYQQSPSEPSRLRVARLVTELEQIKPGFNYDLDRLDTVTGADLGTLDLDDPSHIGGDVAPEPEPPHIDPFDLRRFDAA